MAQRQPHRVPRVALLFGLSVFIAGAASAKALKCESAGLIARGKGEVNWRYDPSLDAHWPNATDRDRYAAVLAVLIERGEREADAAAVAALEAKSKGLACEVPCVLSLDPKHGLPYTTRSEGRGRSISPWKLSYACRRPPVAPPRGGAVAVPPQPGPGGVAVPPQPGQGGPNKKPSNPLKSILGHVSIGVGVGATTGGGRTTSGQNRPVGQPQNKAQPPLQPPQYPPQPQPQPQQQYPQPPPAPQQQPPPQDSSPH